MSSLIGERYYNDDWPSMASSSLSSQDVSILNNSRLASSFWWSLSESKVNQAPKPVHARAIQRPGAMVNLHPTPSSYSILFRSFFKDKLNAITSESHELEITKDILRIRNDWRRVSEPTTSLNRKESQEACARRQSIDEISDNRDNRVDNDGEVGPFLKE